MNERYLKNNSVYVKHLSMGNVSHRTDTGHLLHVLSCQEKYPHTSETQNQNNNQEHANKLPKRKRIKEFYKNSNQLLSNIFLTVPEQAISTANYSKRNTPQQSVY